MNSPVCRRHLLVAMRTKLDPGPINATCWRALETPLWGCEKGDDILAATKSIVQSAIYFGAPFLVSTMEIYSL